MNEDRHFYLYAKYHYKMTDMLADLSIIYNRVYGFDKDDAVPVVYLVDILQKLAYVHMNEYNFHTFVEDILPENTWKHGYITEQSKMCNGTYQNYDVKIAIISKLLSILRLSTVSEIPFELGVADDSILPLRKKKEV